MKMCLEHWAMCREAVMDRGMGGLIAKSGEQAVENLKTELEGGKSEFDPLMSMHWHWTNAALAAGGLYLLTDDEDGQPYCPLCEHVKHIEGFDARQAVASIADQMRAYCIEEGLIPNLQ